MVGWELDVPGNECGVGHHGDDPVDRRPGHHHCSVAPPDPVQLLGPTSHVKADSDGTRALRGKRGENESNAQLGTIARVDHSGQELDLDRPFGELIEASDGDDLDPRDLINPYRRRPLRRGRGSRRVRAWIERLGSVAAEHQGFHYALEIAAEPFHPVAIHDDLDPVGGIPQHGEKRLLSPVWLTPHRLHHGLIENQEPR